MKDLQKRPVYIIDGARTPFIKMHGKPNAWSAADLGVAAGAPLLARQPFQANAIEEVVVGCVGPASDEANIARIIALRLGCGNFVPAWTVQRNCASGLQALESAALDIASGKYDLVLAGGTEAMSRAPLLFRDDMTLWLSDLQLAKGIKNKLLKALQFKPRYLSPVFALLNALTDPIVNLSMGQTAENLVAKFGITRDEQDAYAMQSHQRAVFANQNGYMNEIVPLFDWQGKVFTMDNGIRADSSMQKLSSLKPVFDRNLGSVTAGNSSQISDGAAFLLLASEESVKKHKLPVMGKIIDTAWAALDPAYMGMGPVHAIHKLLNANQLSMEEIDFWEINEAFSAQVLANIKCLQDEGYLKENLNASEPKGNISNDKLNVDGGSIAIGHPVGASGARLVLHLLHILKRNNARRGVASLCIGGGQGGAMLIESVSEVL